jgi:hypothetical protein
MMPAWKKLLEFWGFLKRQLRHVFTEGALRFAERLGLRGQERFDSPGISVREKNQEPMTLFRQWSCALWQESHPVSQQMSAVESDKGEHNEHRC